MTHMSFIDNSSNGKSGLNGTEIYKVHLGTLLAGVVPQIITDKLLWILFFFQDRESDIHFIFKHSGLLIPLAWYARLQTSCCLYCSGTNLWIVVTDLPGYTSAYWSWVCAFICRGNKTFHSELDEMHISVYGIANIFYKIYGRLTDFCLVIFSELTKRKKACINDNWAS